MLSIKFCQLCVFGPKKGLVLAPGRWSRSNLVAFNLAKERFAKECWRILQNLSSLPRLRQITESCWFGTGPASHSSPHRKPHHLQQDALTAPHKGERVIWLSCFSIGSSCSCFWCFKPGGGDDKRVLKATRTINHRGLQSLASQPPTHSHGQWLVRIKDLTGGNFSLIKISRREMRQRKGSCLVGNNWMGGFFYFKCGDKNAPIKKGFLWGEGINRRKLNTDDVILIKI